MIAHGSIELPGTSSQSDSNERGGPFVRFLFVAFDELGHRPGAIGRAWEDDRARRRLFGACEAGRRARQACEPQSANPHERSDDAMSLYSLWLGGWQDRDLEIRSGKSAGA